MNETTRPARKFYGPKAAPLTHTPLSDDELAALFTANAGMVFATVKKFANPHADDWQELVAETFLGAWRRRRNYNPAVRVFPVWLYLQARSTVFESYRARERRAGMAAVVALPTSPGLEPADPKPTPLGELAERELRERVAAAVGRLEKTDRELIDARLDGTKFKDLAGGLSKQRAHQRYAAAVKEMAAELVPAFG